MIKDFHTHPQVITKPEGVDEFLRSAMEKGVKQICFTDHMPLSISRAKDRIPAGMVSEYCKRVREIKEEYRGKIDVLCGIEIDFHPLVMGEIEEVLGEGEFDYILGSSHMHLFYKGQFENFTRDSFAEKALQNSLLAVESGLFSALSHFDMFRFTFENPEKFPLGEKAYSPLHHEALIKTILKKAAEKGICLEINPHLAEAKGNDLTFLYPERRVMEWALETEGLTFSYGSDAHNSRSVAALLPEIRADELYGKAIALWEAE